MRALMSTRRAIVGGALAVSLVASTAPAYAQTTYGVTEAPTPAGIRLAHMQIAGEKDQAFAFFWRDRHALHQPEKMGLVGLAPTVMLNGGAASLDGGALEEELKDLGVNINLRRNARFASGEMSGLASAMADSAPLLKSLLTEPRLPLKTLERAKRAMLASARASRENPESMASRALSQILIGDHPLAILNAYEPTSVISDVTAADIDAWRRAALARDNLTVVATGPMSRDEAAALVDSVFGALPAKADMKAAPAFEPRRAAKTILIERPAAQSIIVAGQTTRWNATTEGFARTIALASLGQGSSSRLFIAVREKLGAAYGAQAGVTSLINGVFRFSMQAAVANDKAVQALEAMRQEYRRFLEQGVTAAEADAIKKRMLASHANAMRRPLSAANVIRNALMAGWPADAPSAFADRLEKTTVEEINGLIKKHLSDELTTIVVAPSREGIKADCVIASIDQLKSCELR